MEDIKKTETVEAEPFVPVEEENSFDFRTILSMFILNWQWFLLSAFICLCAAFIYLRYTTPTYQVSAKMLIKNENFIIIQGWMINRLGLSGNELLIYAAIFGFSQDGKSNFEGSRQYLAEWCNASISTVGRCLKSLIDKGLIEQVYHSVDNQTVVYKAHIDPRVKMTLASGQNDPSY